MKKCPNCGAQMNDDGLFCTECGKPIPQGSVCPHCGALVNDSDAFCQSCGKRVDENPSTETSERTQNKCPNCGAFVNDSDVFCQSCGKRVDEIPSTEMPDTPHKRCPYCGALVNNSDDFCQNCGRNLSNGSIGFTSSEIQQDTYLKEESASKKTLPIIIGILAIAIIGGGIWYWNSNKSEPPSSSSIQKDDSINAVKAILTDSIEEVVDSVMVDESLDDYEIDTVATDNYERYDESENDYLESVEEIGVHKEDDPNKILDVSEQMPSFPGGAEALMNYISSNVHYPVVAEENGIQGNVIVTFVVERDGTITDVKIAKSVDPSLDKEAIRIVKSMPRWNAGMQDGKLVRVKYTIPVKFRLQ